MALPVKLRVYTCFGASLNSTLLLACHPDEFVDENDNEVPNARTLVLQLSNGRAVFVGEVGGPLFRSWFSAGSQTAYCTSEEFNNELHIWRAGHWSKESFESGPAPFIRFVYGWSGQTPEEDVLFLAAEELLFVRQNGVWSKHPVPDEWTPWQIVAAARDQVYLGGSELYLWNGSSLTELGLPDGDSARCLALTADDRLVAGERYVSLSRPDGSWERLAMPTKGFYMFNRLGDTVYGLSDDMGVLRLLPGPPVAVTRTLDATALIHVGDGLVAIGNDGVIIFDGSTWSEVDIPLCEVRKQPL
jgi:hypothetical protein